MEIRKKHYCKNCKKDTIHIIKEDALEVEYRCTQCDRVEDIVKTFF